MRQAVLRRPGELEILDVVSPEPGPRELRVRSVTVGSYGADLHALLGC